MICGNLPDGGHDKATSLLTRGRDNVTPRRGGDIPQRRYWVFYLECCRGVLMRRRGYVALRRRWVFHLKLV